ncbi:hypothetical protein B0A55_00213 [Friedmanniomyces simplex]|uniref:Uncharacterized protein n=1 Tax=Friedmanniomyces simplex TaxID=329884 RepID=A0A4U0Y5S2_9PEZI|nr:hypothetical protein B0A55_00213 [Friedmanniomyces simplex]
MKQSGGEHEDGNGEKDGEVKEVTEVTEVTEMMKVKELKGDGVHTETGSAVTVDQVVDTEKGKLGLAMEEVTAKAKAKVEVEVGANNNSAPAVEGAAIVDSTTKESNA